MYPKALFRATCPHPTFRQTPYWVELACDPDNRRFRQALVMSAILFRFHPACGAMPAFIRLTRRELGVVAHGLCIRTVQSALNDLRRLKLIECRSDGRALIIQLTPYSLQKCKPRTAPKELRKVVQKETGASRRRVSRRWYEPDRSGDMRVFIDGALVERVADTGNDERRMIIEALIVAKYGKLPATPELYQRRYAEFDQRRNE